MKKTNIEEIRFNQYLKSLEKPSYNCLSDYTFAQASAKFQHITKLKKEGFKNEKAFKKLRKDADKLIEITDYFTEIGL